MQKDEILKLLNLARGTEKSYHEFPSVNLLHVLYMGLAHNFHGQEIEGTLKFLKFEGEGWGLKYFCNKKKWQHQALTPYKCL